jgi:hypothetical protein
MAKDTDHSHDSDTSDEEVDVTEKEDLRNEVKELNSRIAELEGLISQLQEPLRQMQSAAKGYFKFIDLYVKYGGVSPDVIIPDIKDSISKEIVKALFERNGQNISQLTEMVRSKRGSASRRIIRQKLSDLVDAGHVTKKTARKAAEYYISDELLKKWSAVLGFKT